jgi:hypothetical protein
MVSLDDFSDTPLSNTPAPALDAECRQFIAYVEGVAEDDTTSYAADILHLMIETVKRTGRVTDGQRDAVANVIEGARKRERNQHRGGSRRYEGWRR